MTCSVNKMYYDVKIDTAQDALDMLNEYDIDTVKDQLARDIKRYKKLLNESEED